jgi:hypothetical protein
MSSMSFAAAAPYSCMNVTVRCVALADHCCAPPHPATAMPAGPDSWSYWAPKEGARKLMSADAAQEGGNYGPDSWSYWAPKEGARKLQGAEATQEGGSYGERPSIFSLCLCSMVRDTVLLA